METDWRRLFTLFVLMAVALTGCGDDTFTGPPDEQALAVEETAASLTAVPGVLEVLGESGPGSAYALLKPAEWNGGLVVWAHGYDEPFRPVELPVDEHLPAVRDHALEAGYGFAYASYSHNGYAVKEGAQRTHELRGLFADAFAAPDLTYLIGISMGGLIVEMLSERYPAQYDGTLAACPVLDGPYNAAYVAHFRVLFDWFFRDPATGASPLPGTLYAMPEGYYLIPPNPLLPGGSPAFQAVYGAVTASEAAVQTAAAMATVEQIDLKLAQETFVSELVTSFLLVLGYQINGANALSDLLHGHAFFDNSGTLYTSPLLNETAESFLNHPTYGVARFTGDPPGEKYLEHWWQPEGDLSDPFLTLHTTRDPLVPFRMEERFREKVEAAGSADFLVQQSVDEFGHCTYGEDRLLQAFADLVLWVEQGVKPIP